MADFLHSGNGRRCPECQELAGDGIGCGTCAQISGLAGEGGAPSGFWNTYVKAAAQIAEESGTAASVPETKPPVVSRLDRAKEVVRENICDVEMSAEEGFASAKDEIEQSVSTPLSEEEWKLLKELAAELSGQGEEPPEPEGETVQRDDLVACKQ